jgi:hypothetical protein
MSQSLSSGRPLRAGPVGSSELRLLVAVIFLAVRLPQFFCFREQALQYHALVLVGLFRKQIVKVLHVALRSDFIDHGLHSNEVPLRLLPQI